MGIDNLAVLRSLQDIAGKQIEHNFLVNQRVVDMQEAAHCEWSDLVAACEAHPNAHLIEVTPNSDSAIKADVWIESEEQAQSAFLYHIGPSDAHLEVHNVTINLPVVKLIVTPQWIVLCAVENFTLEDLSALNADQVYSSYLTGQEFLGRYSVSRREYADMNPPSLYVEYIEDMYFDKYNWKSMHPVHRINQLFNPGTIGFRQLALTPHY